MLIGYLFDNNYWDLKKILYFYFCPQMLPSVRTFYCPNISGQKYLPWLSGPETKNLSFLLSFLYSLNKIRGKHRLQNKFDTFNMSSQKQTKKRKVHPIINFLKSCIQTKIPTNLFADDSKSEISWISSWLFVCMVSSLKRDVRTIRKKD